MANFFDAGADTQQHVDDLMYAAINEYSMENIQGGASAFRTQLMQAANRLGQFRRMQAGMGARASQAQARRLFQPGSGFEESRGMMWGADFGDVAALEYEAMRDSYNLEFQRRQGRASALMQGAGISSQIQRKSPWESIQEVGRFAGEMATSFGGDPYLVDGGTQNPSTAT